MHRKIQFIGSGKGVKETLPLVNYREGKSSEVRYLDIGDTAVVDEDTFEKIKHLVDLGRIVIIQNYFNYEVISVGPADVYDETLATPVFKNITITHSLNLSNYAVTLTDNDNFEAVNLTVNSFDIRLKSGSNPPKKDIGYGIIIPNA